MEGSLSSSLPSSFLIGFVVFNAVLSMALLALIWFRSVRGNDAALSPLQQSLQSIHEKLERVERELRTEIAESSRGGRQELTQNLALFQQSQVQQLTLMQKSISDTLNQQLQQLQKSNADKLDEMRRTVDEKLQTTLEKRLSESFKQVAERLEQVHNGLGQMQKLADGVGTFNTPLDNVAAPLPVVVRERVSA